MNLDAECLVAVTGLFPEAAPNREQRSIARKFPERLAARVRDFLGSDKPAKYKPPAIPKNQDKLHDKLAEVVDLNEVAEWFVNEPDLGAAFASIMQGARDRVLNAWPVFPDPSLGVHNFELGADEMLDVLLELRTLDEVETLFDDMDAFVLLPQQVAAFAACFPELYASVREATAKALVPYLEVPGMKAKRKELSPEKEEQIRTLLQLTPDAPIEAQPAEPQGQPGQKPGRRPTGKKEPEGPTLATPAESNSEDRVSK